MVRDYDELAEVFDAIQRSILKANRLDELDGLLEKWGFSDLLANDTGFCSYVVTGKILIIGESRLEQRVVVAIAESYGIERDRLELHLEYEDAKHFDFHRLQHNSKYAAVLVGPMPHSTPGKGDYSSTISAMEHSDGYPPLIRLGDATELKITKTSLKAGFDYYQNNIAGSR